MGELPESPSRDDFETDFDENAIERDKPRPAESDWREQPYEPNIYVLVNLTPNMIYDVDETKASLTSSYSRTIDFLKKLAYYTRKKRCTPFITYIGKRRVLQLDICKEDPFKDTMEILKDFTQLADQLETLQSENLMTKDDTILLFTNAGSFQTTSIVALPCRTQLIFMDMKYNENELKNAFDLKMFAEESIDDVTRRIRLKDFKTMYYAKAKNGEVLYRLVKDHFMKKSVRIFIGRLKQNAVLEPECRFMPKGNLHIVGFMKSGSLCNMPIWSTHLLVPIDLITISRKELKDSEKKKSRRKKKKHIPIYKKICNPKNKRRNLGLLHMLKECLIKEDCVAIARYTTGQYCAIYAIKPDPENGVVEEFGIALLDIMEEFDFDGLIPYKNEETEKAVDADIHYKRKEKKPHHERHPFKIPSSRSHCSEVEPWQLEAMVPDPNPKPPMQPMKCWQSQGTNNEAQGMNNDFQKVFRLLKKLPDKPENLYLEVNRIRDYAILVGMYPFLREFAEFLRKQVVTMTDVAQRHGNHIIKWLEMELNPTILKRHDQIPVWEDKKPTRDVHREDRHDRDDRDQDSYRRRDYDHRRYDPEPRRYERDYRYRDDRHYDRYDRRYR